jgi:hypothetical protein
MKGADLTGLILAARIVWVLVAHNMLVQVDDDQVRHTKKSLTFRDSPVFKNLIPVMQVPAFLPICLPT